MKQRTIVYLAMMLIATTGVQAQRGSHEARWRAEREGMLKQVLDRGRDHVQQAQFRVKIGTLAPTDAMDSARAFEDLEKLIDADTKRPGPTAVATQPEIASIRIRFAETLNELDRTETRFDVGITTAKALSAALTAAANVVLAPMPPK